jgi:excisionase family DNA binding protein
MDARAKHWGDQMKALQIDAVCDKLGVGRTQVYKLIRAGKLDARKLGARTVVMEDSVDRVLESAPRIEPRQASDSPHPA